MQCPVCHEENDQFALVCTACRAFLQNRIPNLDLFSTVWRVIERPRYAFQQITLAEHKNYSYFLYVLFGIGVSFAGFSLFRVGERFDSLLEVLFWGVVVGFPLGAALAPVIAVAHSGLSRALGGRAGYRVSLGVSAYAFVPIILSVLLILPIEILTFGMYLFTNNPSPLTIKPGLSLALLGIDGALGLWSGILLVLGTSVGHQLGLLRSAVIALVLGGGAVLGLYAAAAFFLHAS
jgi:hypothetical protein